MDEEWRDIPGLGGHYEASSLGTIRTKERGVYKNGRGGRLMFQTYKPRILKGSKQPDGYINIHIGVDGVKTLVGIHRLILLAFRGEPLDGQEGCHNNGIPSDNRIENLRWDTHHNNNQDRMAHGHYAVGEAHPMAKLTKEQAIAIRTRAVTKKEAMSMFGISNAQHHRVMTGQSWSHLVEGK